MNVTNLLRFLQTLEEPLRASGGAKVANELIEVCDGLRPFGEMNITQFAAFLRNADHYAKTGEVPVTASKTKKQSKPVDLEKVRSAAQTITDLYERAIDDGLDYSEIEAQIKQLDKKLTKEEAIALAKEVNIARSVKSKKDAFAAIQSRIFDRKQSYQRTNF